MGFALPWKAALRATLEGWAYFRNPIRRTSGILPYPRFPPTLTGENFSRREKGRTKTPTWPMAIGPMLKVACDWHSLWVVFWNSWGWAGRAFAQPYSSKAKASL